MAKNVFDFFQCLWRSIVVLLDLGALNEKVDAMKDVLDEVAKNVESAQYQKPLEPPVMQEMFEHQDLLWVKGIDVPYCLQCYTATKKLRPMHRLLTRRGKGSLEYDARLMRCRECGKKAADVPSPFDHPKPQP